MAAIEEEIIERLSHLDEAEQTRVLEFVRNLNNLKGIPGEASIARANQVAFDPEDLDEMKRAIEEGCERIDPSEGPRELFA